MLINRHNYETFFLLYADDELRANERKAVEDFVNENEDLKPELQMLLAAVLPVEEIIFADKSFLYKDIVFNAGLQEKLLLKLDDELSASELENVNNILTTNNEALQEYNILLGTKLSAADKIIFEEKHLLYKKEKDNVVTFRFMKWAVAAAIIGFGLFLSISVFNKKEVETSSVAVNKPSQNNSVKQFPTTITDIKNNTAAKIKTETNIANKTVQPIDGKENIAVAKNKKEDNIFKEKSINNSTQKNREELLAINKTTEKTLPLQKIIVKEDAVQEIATIKTIIKDKVTIPNENIVPLENTYAKAVSFTDAEKSENKIFYIDEDEVKRSKVGGFFKKVKRLVERTAKIKTGNSVSIAGFEIASK